MTTSLGYHTFSITLRLTYSDAITLYKDFQRYKNNGGGIRIRPTDRNPKYPNAFPKGYIAEYIGVGRGITWYIRFSDTLSKITEMSLDHRSPNYQKEPEPYSVRARINPKILCGVCDYLTAATPELSDDVEERFNREAKRISPLLGVFGDYSLTRVDYCVNFNVRELGLPCSAKQLIMLLSAGIFPSISPNTPSTTPFPTDKRVLKMHSI